MINLFFSYSHKDESLRNELEKHLSILKRNGVISSWHDRCILPGAGIDEEISMNIQKADIILLLVSSDFLSSDYCYDNEMNYALQKSAKNEVKVLPVILRPCDWKDSKFGKLLAIPTDGKPVVKFPTLDDAFVNIVEHIKRVAVSFVKINDQEINNVSKPIINESVQDLRSSNLRIQKTFTDNDKDLFLDNSFDYIANYLEGSLKQLKIRNPEIDYRFKRIDSQTFTTSLYLLGKIKSECMIYYGTGSFLPKSISYSRNISNAKSSYNENLSLDDDGYLLYLKPSGMSGFGSLLSRTENKILTNEGAAELFWTIFIEPL
ncbi:MAG: toll/interleukin-1 receptor domain-containing protein [Ferruginibacter sp.]